MSNKKAYVIEEINDEFLFHGMKHKSLMEWHEIVKYKPENYDSEGRYTVDEWTSISDVGKTYNGKTLTFDEYLATEQKYVDAIRNIVIESGCKCLIVRYIELYKSYTIKQIKSRPYKEDPEIIKLVRTLDMGKRIYLDTLDKVIRMALREYMYVILSSNEHSLLIESGYDYYMKVCCAIDDPVLRKIVSEARLYLDPRSNRHWL